jgi:hypothetical protein
MTPVSPGGRKFTQAVSNHIFGDIDGHMSPTIMDSNSVSDHLREDGARPAPGPNNPLITTGIHILDSFEQFCFYKGSFLQRTSHVSFSNLKSFQKNR